MKYKILHVVSTLGYGGVSKFILNYYQHIDTRKYQFDFITHGGPEDFHKDLIEDGSEIFYIDTIKKTGLVSYIKKGLEILKEHGTYDAVHIHTDYQAGIYALIAKMAGVKVRICHSHRIDIPNKTARILTPIFRSLTFVSATKLVACSKEAGNFLFTNKQFTVVNNAIDLEEFAFVDQVELEALKSELDISNNWEGILIGHVGNFNDVKNQIFFVPILEELRRRKIEYKLLLVGDGPLKENIESDIKLHGLNDNVIFTGIRADIPLLMHLFDVFVLPSKYEGLGIVTIEAQAAGTPCIVSNTTPTETDMGLSLISYLGLEEGAECWVNNILSVSSEANNKLYSNQDIKSLIGKKGYDIKTSVNKLLSLYNSKL